MRLGFVVDPVEASLDGQASQHAVLAAVPIRGGDVHRAALVVQRLLGVVAVLVPALRDTQLDARPLVHDGDGQRVQLVLAALPGGSRGEASVAEGVRTAGGAVGSGWGIVMARLVGQGKRSRTAGARPAVLPPARRSPVAKRLGQGEQNRVTRVSLPAEIFEWTQSGGTRDTCGGFPAPGVNQVGHLKSFEVQIWWP